MDEEAAAGVAPPSYSQAIGKLQYINIDNLVFPFFAIKYVSFGFYNYHYMQATFLIRNKIEMHCAEPSQNLKSNLQYSLSQHVTTYSVSCLALLFF